MGSMRMALHGVKHGKYEMRLEFGTCDLIKAYGKSLYTGILIPQLFRDIGLFSRLQDSDSKVFI